MIGYYRQREDPKAKLWSARKVDQERDRRLKDKLKETAERYAARIPGLNATTWNQRRVCGEGWALIGDAAGFADPVTGEGIYYALRSAELFAECALASRPDQYEQRWREDFGAELKSSTDARALRKFLGRTIYGAMIEFARGHRGISACSETWLPGARLYDLKINWREAMRPL